MVKARFWPQAPKSLQAFPELEKAFCTMQLRVYLLIVSETVAAGIH